MLVIASVKGKAGLQVSLKRRGGFDDMKMCPATEPDEDASRFRRTREVLSEAIHDCPDFGFDQNSCVPLERMRVHQGVEHAGHPLIGEIS